MIHQLLLLQPITLHLTPLQVIPFEMPLLSLAARLLELLNDFPEQPILELLLKLVRRCLSLPARSPPARYLAGAELLLAKMTDWEKVASSRVTLKDFFPPLARVVLRLRRIEVFIFLVLCKHSHFNERTLRFNRGRGFLMT